MTEEGKGWERWAGSIKWSQEDPQENYIPLEDSEDTPFINDMKNTLLSEADASITKKLGGGSSLQTKAAGRRGGCRIGLVSSHEDGGLLKDQKPGDWSYHNDLQIQKGSHVAWSAEQWEGEPQTVVSLEE